MHLTAKPQALAHPADVLGVLRLATAQHHAALDAAMALSKEVPTLADYAEHLAQQHAWLSPIARWQACFDDGPQDTVLMPPRDRLGLIVDDLSHPSMGTMAPHCPAMAWRGQPHPAWRWGVAYVVEGAQLGGAVQYRRLAPILHPHPLRYLAGEGPHAGTRWRRLIKLLHTEVRQPDHVGLARQGATAAFDGLLLLASRRSAPRLHRVPAGRDLSSAPGG